MKFSLIELLVFTCLITFFSILISGALLIKYENTEAVKHHAAHWVVEDDGDIHFVWNE